MDSAANPVDAPTLPYAGAISGDEARLGANWEAEGWTSHPALVIHGSDAPNVAMALRWNVSPARFICNGHTGRVEGCRCGPQEALVATEVLR
jgi:hypothetical protein